MRDLIRSAALSALLVIAAACEGRGATLTVLLQSDLVAGAQFDRVEVSLWPLTDDVEVVSAAAPRASVPLALGDADADAVLGPGRAVATFVDLPPGRYLGEIVLSSGSALLVRNRFVITTVDAELRLPVPVDAECVGLECPSAGLPSFIACRGGQCVDPACIEDPMQTDEDGEPICGDALTRCDADDDCAALVPCASASCRDGFCASRPDADACGDELYCNVLEGCVRRPPPGAHARCDTVCDVADDPCAIGQVVCAGGTYECTAVGIREPGAPCPGGACDERGRCVAP